LEILQPQKEPYIMQAVNCGLLTEIKAGISSKDEQVEILTMTAVVILCSCPRLFLKMREEGIFPNSFLDLAGSPHPEVVETLVSTVAEQCNQSAAYGALGPAIVELLAAGLVTRLKRAWKKRFRQHPEYGGKLRASFARLEAVAKLQAVAPNRRVQSSFLLTGLELDTCYV
jgi:hypothetical protein